MSIDKDKVFIRRNTQGQIIDVALHPAKGFEPGIIADIQEPSGSEGLEPNPVNSLIMSDLSTVRVLEDLIDLLIGKEVIHFTDLPEAAQKKLLKRQTIRSSIQGLNLLGDEQDSIF